MWKIKGFITIIIFLKMVYCKNIYSPIIKRNPGQFQWQFQSLGGGQSQSIMFPFISGLDSSSSSSSSSSSGNSGVKLIFDNEGSQSQSQSSNIDNGIVKLSYGNKNKSSNNGRPISVMSSSTDKNGVIKIKISGSNIQNLPANIKVQTSDNSEGLYSTQPVIRYIYTTPNKVNQDKSKKKSVIKLFSPLTSASASASASSSDNGQSQSQTVTINNGQVEEVIDDENVEYGIDLEPQVQIQSTSYGSSKGHQKNKLTLRGKSNVDDRKKCDEKRENQVDLDDIEHE